MNTSHSEMYSLLLAYIKNILCGYKHLTPGFSHALILPGKAACLFLSALPTPRQGSPSDWCVDKQPRTLSSGSSAQAPQATPLSPRPAALLAIILGPGPSAQPRRRSGVPAVQAPHRRARRCRCVPADSPRLRRAVDGGELRVRCRWRRWCAVERGLLTRTAQHRAHDVRALLRACCTAG